MAKRKARKVRRKPWAICKLWNRADPIPKGWAFVCVPGGAHAPHSVLIEKVKR